MTALACEPDVFPAFELQLQTGDDLVRSQVWKVLGAIYPGGRFVERRQEQRYPYPRLITLWPMESDGETTSGPPITVVGKHLSERGLGFFHPQPLTNRLVVVSLEKGDGRALSFLLDVHRCRFTRQGWYESGGRFRAAVSAPPSPQRPANKRPSR
ncbi:MAG TPA: hypothetical protein VNH11_20215 [Pirellulales bacterium]|nr:hypothetical protein [Pirellulales bacterium]